MMIAPVSRTILALSIFAAGAVPASAQNVAAGAALFKQRCEMCHSVVPGKVSPMAPNLSGLKGRKAGSTGFAYSPALKNANLIWTPANLDTFLTAPAKLVPGTRMVIAVPVAAQRSDIIAFLTAAK